MASSKLIHLIYFILILCVTACTSSKQVQQSSPVLRTKTMNTDRYFNSKQKISFTAIPLVSSKYTMTFADAGTDLIKTSILAKNRNAIAAINGGFFNTKKGGSVTYFELDNSTISPTRTAKKDQKPSYFLDGAVIIEKDNDIRIEPLENDQFYIDSKDEKAVLVTGPLLLQDGNALTLKDIPFVTKRHPRSCLCLTNDEALLIAIDGRSDEADGMTLPEVQQVLSDMDCLDAINLDGGGSTTLWNSQSGIINNPSDKEGERRVSNALIVLEN